MSFVYPWVLGATFAAIVGVIAAHLLSVRRPPELLLPTASFLDDRQVRAVARSSRPSDRWLLLLRSAALLLAGLALAGMTWTGRRASTVGIVVLDARGDAAPDDSLAWRDAVERAMRAAGADSLPSIVVWSDGRVMQIGAGATGAAWDSVWPSDSGTLASALLAAHRAAPRLAMHADSIAMHVVSPLREDVTSSALDAVRDAWPGRIQVQEVAADTAVRSVVPVEVRADARDDIAAAGFARWGGDAYAPTRIVRSALSADDSAFAEAGGALVHWPVERAEAADTTELPAVVANGVVLIGAGLERISSADAAGRERIPSADAAGRAIVWWADGATAATEQAYGAGCIRTVAFTAPEGDALLDASASGVLSALAAPCGVRGTLAQPARLSAPQIERLQGQGSLAAAAPFREQTSASPMARWLLLAALALLFAELIARTRGRAAGTQTERNVRPGERSGSANSAENIAKNGATRPATAA